MSMTPPVTDSMAMAAIQRSNMHNRCASRTAMHSLSSLHSSATSPVTEQPKPVFVPGTHDRMRICISTSNHTAPRWATTRGCTQCAEAQHWLANWSNVIMPSSGLADDYNEPLDSTAPSRPMLVVQYGSAWQPISTGKAMAESIWLCCAIFAHNKGKQPFGMRIVRRERQETRITPVRRQL